MQFAPEEMIICVYHGIMVMLSLHVCIICVLYQRCEIAFVAIELLLQSSNSVPTQGKEMLSLHVCTKYVQFYKYEIAFVAIKQLFIRVVGSLDTVARGDDFLCLRVWQCRLFICVLNQVFNIKHVKLHLLQLNHFSFMQASSKQLAKDSNSVSTQGKEMLSLHACAKCI